MSVELLHIDCMDYMKGLKDKAFDLAVVDPPYGIDTAQLVWDIGRKLDFNRWTRKHKKYKEMQWNAKPTDDYFNELFRISKEQIIWGANHFYLPPVKCLIFWDKQNGDFSFSDGEVAWSSIGNSIKKFTYRWAGMLKGANGNCRENRFHPTQKPIALYKWLLQNYAKPGDKILDTHLGSGSSAIAAEKMGFDFVGCEIDKDYYDAAVKRFNKETDKGLFKDQNINGFYTPLKLFEIKR